MKTITFLLFLKLFAFNAFATEQDPDLLLIEGYTVYLKCFPLEDLELQYRPFGLTLLTAPNTACWRGYQAIWRLQNDSLFLEKILACPLLGDGDAYLIEENSWKLLDAEPQMQEDLLEFFRKNGLESKVLKGRVFADWYNKVLVEPSNLGVCHYKSNEFKRTIYEQSEEMRKNKKNNIELMFRTYHNKKKNYV
ncbi:MAG: hypothetical protein R3E32_22940 [Chitinophagales bacterium]